MLAGEDATTRRANGKALLCLFLIAAPLAEILSENQPLLQFLKFPNPVLLTAVYGLPVLMIREFAARRRLNLAGILLLGLAYGFLNEGVIAKTLTLPSGPPVNDFAGYGRLGTLQGGWALMIVPWHALHSVLYPILITHWLFPSAAGRPWLRPRPLKILLVPLALLYLPYFFSERREPGPYLFYILATALLVFLAARFFGNAEDPPADAAQRPRLRLAGAGALMLAFYIFQFASARHFPFAPYAVVSCGFYAFLAWRALRWRPVPEMLLFGLGDDLSFSVFTAAVCVASGRMSVQTGIAGAVFLALFIWFIRAVRRAPAGRAPKQA